MQIWIENENGTVTPHRDRVNNTLDWHDRDEACRVAKELSRSKGSVKVVLGQSPLAEYQDGELAAWMNQ